MINSNARAATYKRASELVEKLVLHDETLLQPQKTTGSDAEIYSHDCSDKFSSSFGSISRNTNVFTNESSDIFFSKEGKRTCFGIKD